MFAKDHTLANVDPELWGAIQKENTRQQDHIGAKLPKPATQIKLRANAEKCPVATARGNSRKYTDL